MRLGTTASARQSRCYTATMPDDMTRHAATHDVPPRHDATNDSTYCLTPDAVVERLAHAGVPRDLDLPGFSGEPFALAVSLP